MRCKTKFSNMHGASVRVGYGCGDLGAAPMIPRGGQRLGFNFSGEKLKYIYA